MGDTRKTSPMFLFLYAVFFVSANTCVVVGLNLSSADAVDIKCIDRERHALLMIKKDLVDEYGYLSSWGDQEDQKDCCNWRGIKCNNRTHHVTMLDLHVSASVWKEDFYYGPLKGKISPSLIELQHLTYLDISNNDFGGSHVPAFIGSLTKLTYLNLSHAPLVPYQLGNSSSLNSLDLNLRSETLSWLSHLSSLRYLDMSSVNLEKVVDWIQAINMLPSIVDLRLRGCSLSSVVPPHLSLYNSSSSLSVLDLSDNSLNSTIYHWLFNFVGHNLVDLDLSSNHLEGLIPDAFGNMTSLAHIDLHSNLIEGGIPKSLGNLLHLQTLDLSYNSLDGTFPEIVRNLSGHAMNTLEILDLSLNKISGHVPDITIFSSLKELRLYLNNLNESLPSRFENSSKLEVFLMSYNLIKGSLPDLSVFSSLRTLALSNNQINGRLPESIGQLSKLEYLDVSSNKLQGTISEAHFSTLTELKDLDLSNNLHLILDISSECRPSFQLNRLVLPSCKLGPHFPVWLRNQRNLSYLDVSNAGISDVIPNWFWDLHHNSFFLNLSYNNIKGILPDLSSHFSGFPIIVLRSNHLEGPIPRFPSNTTYLDLSKNRFRGPISVICSISGGYLKYLDLSDNLLSGQLPDCWRQSKELSSLNLANNQFDGMIPNSMGFLGIIESLHLNYNRLTGEFPSSLQNCTNLVTMDVGENKLTGKLPAWIGEKFSRLIIFRLRSNDFYGSIPIQLCYLQSIQLFDISLNSITGTIPRCFNNFTALAQNQALSETIRVDYTFVSRDKDGNITYIGGASFVDYALVSWKGRIYEYGSTLRLVKGIDLSSNKLTGEIPLEITNLSGLVALNLSRNNLVSLIPLDIGRLRKLESLDLSRNKLVGKIPMSLSDLNGLSSLDLSHNNLSGKIPSSTQLQSLEASAFTENPSLCGPPLTQKCPGDYTNQVTPTTSGAGEDAEVEFVLDRWFYASLALGFIVGFWGVCGTLVLKQSWRHAYFRFFDNSTDWLYVKIVVHTARFKRKLSAGLDRFL